MLVFEQFTGCSLDGHSVTDLQKLKCGVVPLQGISDKLIWLNMLAELTLVYKVHLIFYVITPFL